MGGVTNTGQRVEKIEHMTWAVARPGLTQQEAVLKANAAGMSVLEIDWPRRRLLVAYSEETFSG